MAGHALAFRNALLTISLSIGLIACGGGGGGEGGESANDSWTEVAPPSAKPEDFINARTSVALSTGSTANLTLQDQTSLLKWALNTAEQQHYWQKNLLGSLYSNANHRIIQASLQFTVRPSLNLYPTDLSTGIPFAMGDKVCDGSFAIQSGKGCGLGVVTKIGKGRALAYGQEMFSPILSNNANFTQFTEVMNNSLRWLITGDAHQAVNKTLNIVVKGTSNVDVKSYLEKQLATKVNYPACNVLDPANTCWQDVDLIVLGQGIEGEKFEKELIDKYLKAGKAIYFQGSYWDIQANTQKVLNAIGIQADMNWFRDERTLLMSNPANIEQRWERINQIDGTIKTLQYFINPASVTLGELNASNAMIQSMLTHSSALQRLNAQGLSAFSEENKNSILKALVLIADLWRPSVNYTGLNKNGNPLTFMQTYASDAWLDYKRSYTKAALQGAGDYMPASAQNMPVSSDWETITVTIPQSSGVTAIGRASIPAKAVDIQIVDAQGANLAVQTSHIRTWGNPFSDDGYKRPLRPNSYGVKLNTGVDNKFVSPFGGPLMLNYSNATAGSTITLKIKGSAKYAHFDFTQPITDADIDAASVSLQSRVFGWNTFKFVGGEIQQITAYALNAIGNTAPRDYIERIKTVIYDSNHMANGYNNMPLDNSTQQYCNTLGWDCTGEIHRAPNVQHFVGWIATCGFLCSGNPSDGATGLDIGWGWVHELGHNTVQGVLTMTFPSTENGNTIGCGTECNNNILAGVSMLRKYEIYDLDNNGNNFNHPLLYGNIKDSRNTNFSGEALRAEMEKRLWQGNDNAKQAFHMQLAHNYTKLHQGKLRPDSQGVFEFMRLLNISQRLYNQIDVATATTADKNKLGLGAFTTKNLSRPDMIYVLSSKIMGYDLKEMFKLYGVPVTDTAHTSIAMLKLPMAPLNFYAQPANRSNHLNEGTWLTLPATGAVPNYPY
ncbi:ImpA family metalloprotease [Acinetobacter sp. ANC 4470]|uniref:ImpA family metalloprotease n=1 Tax=Acinetobacter sp. ANC 4470 TaxID=1977881 RepID=UPI001D1775F4|nr:ImpA family metalloprotease [Acinetobacter sp. ANC 4470]